MIRGSTKIFLETIAAVALVIGLGVGVGIWRLSEGPVSIGMLTPYLETALGDPVSGRRVSIGASSLTWDRDEHAVEVRADRVSVIDGAGRPVAVIPEMALRFRLGALLQGILVPREISVLRPQIQVIRDAGGRWRLATPADGDAPAAATDGPAGVPFDRAQAIRALAPLDRVRVHEARVVVEDRRLGASWVVPRATAMLQRQETGIAADLSLELDLDGRSVPLHAGLRLDAALRPLAAELRTSELVPAAIGRRVPDLAVLAALELPFAGTVGVERPLESDARLRFNLTAGAGRLVRPELPDGALPVVRLALRGGLERAGERLTLDSAALELQTTAILLAGQARALTGALEAEGTLSVPSLALDDLKRYWPPEVAPNPRRWMIENLSHGTVRDTSAKFALRRVRDDIDLVSLDGSMAVDGARVRYMRPQPPVEQVTGTIRFDTQRFDIAVKTGRLRGLRLESGQITISGLQDPDQRLALTADVTGALPELLGVLDLPPFGYVKRFGIAPQSIAGDMAAKLTLDFPLIEKLALDHVALKATGKVSGLRLPRAVRDFDLTDGRFDVNLDKAGMGVFGQGQIAGIPAQIGWTENFDRVAPFRRRYEATGSVNDAQRRTIGLDVGEYATGPIGVALTFTDQTDPRSLLAATLDLRDATLRLDEIGWRKPVGEAATGRVELTLRDGKLATLDRGEIAGGGLTARMAGAFGAQGKLARLELQQLKAGETDVSGRVSWNNDVPDITLTGRSLDATALLADDPAKDGGKDKPPRAMGIAASIERVRLAPDRRLDKVDLRARSDGKRWRSASLQARTGDTPLSLELAPRDGARRLTIASDDAGAAIQAFGLTDSIHGGKLRVTGRYDDSGPEDKLLAHVAIDDFRVLKLPVLANLLAVASVTGIPDLLSGPGIAFQDLSTDIVKMGDKLQIIDGKASGNAMGLTAQGTITGADDVADITGTIVPINSINGLVAAIPLIGDIVTGRGGGLFAFTYRVQGPLDNPSVSVNPLSVLAPGFLRNLFQWLPSVGGKSNGPPPSDAGKTDDR